jgi:hypothetical protein
MFEQKEAKEAKRDEGLPRTRFPQRLNSWRGILNGVSRWYQRNYRRLLPCLPFSSIVVIRFGIRSPIDDEDEDDDEDEWDMQNRNKGHKRDAQTVTEAMKGVEQKVAKGQGLGADAVQPRLSWRITRRSSLGWLSIWYWLAVRIFAS